MSSEITSTSSKSQIEELITLDLLEGILEFWFNHLEKEDDYIIPSPSHMKHSMIGQSKPQVTTIERDGDGSRKGDVTSVSIIIREYTGAGYTF